MSDTGNGPFRLKHMVTLMLMMLMYMALIYSALATLSSSETPASSTECVGEFYTCNLVVGTGAMSTITYGSFNIIVGRNTGVGLTSGNCNMIFQDDVILGPNTTGTVIIPGRRKQDLYDFLDKTIKTMPLTTVRDWHATLDRYLTIWEAHCGGHIN